MDPKANLAEQLKLVALILNPPQDSSGCHECGAEYDLADRAERLAELVLALDEWRRAGGFDPYAS